VNNFGNSHLADDLGRRAVRAGAFSGAGHAAQFLLMSAGTVVLARLLTPEDYGLVAMVTAVTSIVAGFKDLGLAASTVQRPEINHQQTSTLFWINVGFGLILAVVVSAAAPALARFYDEPRVRWLTVAMASTYLVSGLATQHHSLLRRQLRFGEVAGIELVATFVAVSAAIAAAWNGASYWSLVLMYALTHVCITIGVWIRCSWRPGKPAGAAGVRDMLAYGGYLTGFNIVNFSLRSLDRILIGWTASAGPVGLYSRAAYLVSIPVERLSGASTGVAIPVLSRLQGDPERYRSFLLTATMLFGTIAIPFGCFAFTAAESTVLAVLGAKWSDAVPILRVLAPMAIFATLETAAMWVAASTGHTQRQFVVGVALALASAVAMIVGLQWGVIGVAIGFSGGYCVAWAVGLSYCVRPSPVTASDILGTLWRPAAAAVAAGAVTMVAGRAGQDDGRAILMLARDIAVFATTYGLGWLLLPGGRATLREMLTLAKALRP
jgi:O-antigen/teichoic acid export membrane protein